MKYVQLYRNGEEILGSDGIMSFPQRTTPLQAIRLVRERNTKFEKNFPHKVATEVGLYLNKIGSQIIFKAKI